MNSSGNNPGNSPEERQRIRDRALLGLPVRDTSNQIATKEIERKIFTVPKRLGSNDPTLRAIVTRLIGEAAEGTHRHVAYDPAFCGYTVRDANGAGRITQKRQITDQEVENAMATLMNIQAGQFPALMGKPVNQPTSSVATPGDRGNMLAQAGYLTEKEIEAAVEDFNERLSHKLPDVKKRIDASIKNAILSGSRDPASAIHQFLATRYQAQDKIAEVIRVTEEIAENMAHSEHIQMRADGDGSLKIVVVYTQKRAGQFDPAVLDRVKELQEGGAIIKRESLTDSGDSYVQDVCTIKVAKGAAGLAMPLTRITSRGFYLMQLLAAESVLARAESGLIVPMLMGIAKHMVDMNNVIEGKCPMQAATIKRENKRILSQIMDFVNAYNKATNDVTKDLIGDTNGQD